MNKKIKTALILAAGMGSRLFPVTQSRPKAFLEVGDRSLIERSIEQLVEAGVEDIVIGCGHQAGHFERLKNTYPVRLYENTEYETTGSFYTLLLAEELITVPFLLLESDILYESRAIETLLESEEGNLMLLSEPSGQGDEVYVETTEENDLFHLSKDPDDLQSIDGELVGIWKLTSGYLSGVKRYFNEQGGYRKMHYETALADYSRKEPISCKKVDDLIWCEIDNQEHWEHARTEILPKLEGY